MCQKQNEMQPPATSIVEEFSGAGVEFITQIIDVAKTGLCDQLTHILRDAVFKNEQVKKLAETVVGLVAENEYLKKTNKIVTPDVRVTPQSFDLFFGPQNAYRLSIAFENENMRDNFARLLRFAADNLEHGTTEKTPQQMKFPF